jgi:hypothetical protein
MRLILLGCALAIGACGDSTEPPPPVIAVRFLSQPSTVRIDTPFSVSIELIGRDGQRALTSTDAVTLSLIGSGTLSGTTTVIPAQGVASFTGLRLSATSESLQLKATAAGITATSPTFRTTDDCAPVTTAFPLTLTGSLENAACVVEGRPTAFYRFTKPAFGPLQIIITATNAAFTPEISVLNDPPSDYIPVSSNGTSAAGTWVLPAAPYRLMVSAPAGAGGAFTITASTAVAEGCVLRTLLPFALVTYPGRIEAGDCAEGGKRYDWYQVYSPKPCTMAMRGTSTGFDAFISIRNARTHAIVAEDDNAAGGVGGKDAGVMLTQCRDGSDPIEILATVAGTGVVGDYTLALQITGGVSTFLIGPGTRRR